MRAGRFARLLGTALLLAVGPAARGQSPSGSSSVTPVARVRLTLADESAADEAPHVICIGRRSGPRSPTRLASGGRAAEPPIRPIPFNQPRPGGSEPTDDALPSARIQLEPPGPERLFRLESEQALKERMRREVERPAPLPVIFPEEPSLSGEPSPAPRLWQLTKLVEPNYVCYRPLLFEEKNSERYGWDLGLLSPLVSTGAFYFDLFLLPCHLKDALVHPAECSAGLCLPGDPVPYLLEPPLLNLVPALGGRHP